VLLLALLALALVTTRGLCFLWTALHTEAGRYDFSTFYAAATALRANPHANIYDPAVLAHAGAAAHVLVRPPLAYTYPPLLAMLLAPVTALPFRLLSRIWLLGNVCLWIVVTLLLAREIALPLAAPLRARLGVVAAPKMAPDSINPRAIRSWLRADPTPLAALALASVLTLGAAPATQTLLTGQVDLLVLLPLALVPELTRRGHERLVGALLASAALLKLTPLLLLGYLVLRGRRRALGAAVVTLAALLLLCLLVVGPGTLLAALPQALRTGASDLALGHNEALLASFLPARTSLATWTADFLRLGLGVLVAILLWRWPVPAINRQSAPETGSHASERLPESETRAYAVALCALLLLSPVAWVHHYVWVLPAAAIALGHTAARWRSAPSRASALAFIIVLFACLAITWPLPYAWDTQPHPTVTSLLGLPLRPLALELRALGTLALLGVLSSDVITSLWHESVPRSKRFPGGPRSSHAGDITARIAP
jgi:alpha-1,2-mannosyltransferase